MRDLQLIYGGLGQFSINRSFLYTQDPEIIQAIMFGLIIVSAEQYWEGDRIIYRAFGPDFEEVEQGLMIPEYEAVVTKQTLANEENLYHTRWRKLNRT